MAHLPALPSERDLRRKEGDEELGDSKVDIDPSMKPTCQLLSAYCCLLSALAVSIKRIAISSQHVGGAFGSVTEWCLAPRYTFAIVKPYSALNKEACGYR
jgi:hypothetical protein